VPARIAVVTGAYGYLGAVIRARLQAAGWSTRALVRCPRPGDRAATWSLGQPPPEDALRHAEVLVHCAYDFRTSDPASIWHVNVEGSRMLLRAAKDHGVARLLVLSSMSAYEGTTQLYGRAKLAIEAATLELGGIAVRPGLVYGDAAGGMAGTLRQLTHLPLVPVIAGSARQFPVHEADFVDAVLRILEAPAWTPEVIGVAQPTSVTFRELLAALAAGEGRSCRFVPVPWRAVYWTLRLVEALGASPPLRSDSVLGLVRPPPAVPVSKAFPDLLASLRLIEPPTAVAA
jgi:nucleoside-diphosphate-sugar epimerase